MLTFMVLVSIGANMAAKNSAPSGLAANHWDDPDAATTPDWAAELLEIPGVYTVTNLREREAVAVGTHVFPDEDGVAEPAPDMMAELDGHADWGIRQVKLRETDTCLHFRVELVPRTPTCDAEDCMYPATGTIEDIRLDGTAFTINTCDKH